MGERLMNQGRRAGTLLAMVATGLWIALTATGCVSMMAERLTDGLGEAIRNHDDPETVAAGAPAYLLMIDGLIAKDPDNPELLRAAAELYTAYTGLYVTDPARGGRLTERAREYAGRALCSQADAQCGLITEPFDRFAAHVAQMTRSEVPCAYALGAAWASWIQVRSGDWEAIAQIARVEKLMARVVALEESYRDGAAHLYLGVLATLLPPAMGGRPEEGRAHFERAIALSKGCNLMANVMYARQYARMVFDRPLHDRLLKDTLAARPDQQGYTLSNIQARQEARALLDSADDYF